MLSPIKSIVIVGGGVAGWLSAYVLSKLRDVTMPWLEITVLDSSKIGPIGVGEATTTTTRNSLLWLEIDENDWLKQVDGSFKYGVRLRNWYERNQHYWHVFEKPGSVDGVAIPLAWLASNARRHFSGFSYDCFMAPYLCDETKAPRQIGDETFDGVVDYGYHLDAAKHLRYFRSKCEKSVTWHDDKVVDATVDANGFIQSVLTESGQRFSADLFIDCTGFQGLLINQKLKEPFIPFSGELLCDRAIAIQQPYESENAPIQPYTSATAREAGWCWDIPLQSRVGSGYVHSSQHVSEDDAMATLSNHIGRDASKLDPRVIRMRTGQQKRTWVNNCVSIGLASGFIEPLESTGNSFIEIAVVSLHDVLLQSLQGPVSTKLIDDFNHRVFNIYQEVRDFIVLHYYLTTRQDTPFWEDVRKSAHVPDTVLEKVSFMLRGLPGRDVTAQGLPWHDWMFPQFSYLCIFAGMNCLPRVDFHDRDPISGKRLTQAMGDLQALAYAKVKALPDLRAFLSALKSHVPASKTLR